MELEEIVRHWAGTIGGDVVLPIAAAQVIQDAEINHPGALDRWLHQHAEHFVALRLGTELRSHRTVAQRRRGARTFQQLAEEVRAGGLTSAELRDQLEAQYCVDDRDTWRKFGDMTRADCLYVAADREQRAEANMMEAAFMRAVAKKLSGAMTVKDVLGARRPAKV